MDTLTKKLIDKAAAYNAAYNELRTINDDFDLDEVEYSDGQDYVGTFCRAWHIEVGFSSKYYYE